MYVRGLDADAPGPGETVEDEVAAAAEDAGAQPVHLLLHRDLTVAVDPTAGLDVDRLAGLEHLVEHVPVAVQPHDALAALGLEAIDEEAGAAEEHVRDAFHAIERVVDVRRGREELMLAHEERLSGQQMQRKDVPRVVAGERDLTRAL